MGLNYFVFNGIPSIDFGVYIGGQGTFDAPQRDVSKVSIPGRNGDLIFDNGRYLNAQVPYNIVVMRDFRERTDAIREWLSGPVGYVRLEDTYHPDEYRMARLAGGVSFKTSAFNATGKATIVFDCKPERFLKSGEAWQSVESGGKVRNPSRFTSRPVLRVYGTGNGTVTVGNLTITLTGIADYVDIDSDLMDCYKGLANCNNKVSMASFPELPEGYTGITYTGDVAGVDVKGRWWTL